MNSPPAIQTITESPIPQHLNSHHYTALSFLLAVASLSFPPKSLLRRSTLVLHLTLLLQAYLAHPPADPNTAVTYTAGLLLGNLTFRYIDRLYLHDAETHFHRLTPSGGTEDAQTLSRPAKIWWSIELLTLTRGIGWDWRVSGIPRAPPQSRRYFLCLRAIKHIAMYASLYAIGLTAQEIRAGWPALSPCPPLLRHFIAALTQNVVFLHLFIVAGYAITIYSHFGILTLPLSLLCVGLRLGPRAWQQPESWPPNFGSPTHAYSIRRFWGSTWHQHLRRLVGAPAQSALQTIFPGRVLASSQTLPARLCKRYFLVAATFLFSGLLHATGTWAVARANHLPPSDGGEVRYFLAQAAALAVEDFVCWGLGVDDSTGPTRTRRWVGYAVTGTWYVWSRVALKVVPLAGAHGVRDEQGRGGVFAALGLVERGVKAVPGNYVAWLGGGYGSG